MDPSKAPLLLSLHNVLYKVRLSIAVLFCIFFGLLGYSLSFLQLDTSALSFFPDEDSEITTMTKAMEQTPFAKLLFVDLSSDSSTPAQLASYAESLLETLPRSLVLPLRHEPSLEPQALMRLVPNYFDSRAEEKLLLFLHQEQVDKKLKQDKEALTGIFGAIMSQWIACDPLGMKEILLHHWPNREHAFWPDPELGYPLSKDKKHLLLILRPVHSIYETEASLQLMDALNKAIKNVAKQDLKVTVLGSLRHTAANTRAINQDVRKIVFFSLIGFALTYLFFVRSMGMIWLLLTPCFAVSCAMACLGLAWPVVSGLALGFGASVLGIAEDYAVHMHFALRSQNVAVALTHLPRPLLQGFLLNISGFMVLLFSALPAVRQLAFFSICTLTCGLILALIFLPLCPFFDQPHFVTLRCARPRSVPRRRLLSFLILLLLATSLLLATYVKIDVQPKTLGAEVASIEQDTENMKEIWGRKTQSLFVIEGSDLSECLLHVREMESFLEGKVPKRAISSLADLLLPWQESAENRARWTQFMGQHAGKLKANLLESAKKYGFSETAFLPFLTLLKDEPLALDLTALRQAGLGDLVESFVQTSQDGMSMLMSVSGITVRDVPSHMAPYVTLLDPALLEEQFTTLFAKEARFVPIVLVLCCLLLFCFFRNVGQILLAAVPPLCAITSILLVHVLFKLPLTLASLAALPLVLGLAADHGILITHDLAERASLGASRAVLVSSLTALTSMGLLAIAEHPSLQAMGLVLFTGLLVEMSTSLWLLPRLSNHAWT